MSSFPPPPDLDTLLADIRARGYGPEDQRYPTELPERFRRKPAPPPGVPERGIFDEALARVRGTFHVSSENPDLFGKRYEPAPAVAGKPDVSKIQQDFEDQVAAGAKQVGANGGDVEDYVHRQHTSRYGPEIASMLKAGRDLAHRRLQEGAPEHEAEAAGIDLAQRHLENLRNRLASGEAGVQAADIDQSVEGLTSSFTSRRGLAKQGLILGVPMAVGAVASGPLGWGALGTYAATAAATAAGQAAEEKLIEGRAPDWESATAAGLAYSLPVPGLSSLARTGAGLESAAARRAVQTLAHAGTQAAEMPLRGAVQNLVEGRPLPTGMEAATQAVTGAIVGGGIGGAMGLLEGERQRVSDDTAGATELEAKPPTREVGRMAAGAADSQLAEIERALGAARMAGDLPAIQSLERGRQDILDARAKGSEGHVTPDSPQPGEAGPKPPAGPPGPVVPPTAGAPSAPPPEGAPPPGPEGGVHLRPQVPAETAAGEAGETTPGEAAGARQAGTAPQVRGLTERAKAEAQGMPALETPPIVRGPTGGAARGVETTPETPTALPGPRGGGQEAPGLGAAPPGPPEPIPAPPAPVTRRLKITRGANGQVDVIFPGQEHADLFSAPGRESRQLREAGTRGANLPGPGPVPNWDGLSARFGLPPDLVRQAAGRYRDAVMEAVRGIPEGETFTAPTLQDVIRPRPAAAPPRPAVLPPPAEIPEALPSEPRLAEPAAPGVRPSVEELIEIARKEAAARPVEPAPNQAAIDAAHEAELKRLRTEARPEPSPPQPRRTIASLPDEYRKPVERAIERFPEPIREQAKNHVEEQLGRRRAVQNASADHDYFRQEIDPYTNQRIVNRPAKRAAAKERMENAKAIYEAGWETIRGVAKDVPNREAIIRRLRQLAEGKGIHTPGEAEPRPPLATHVYAAVRGFVEGHPNAPTMDEAVTAVKDYAKAYPRTGEDVVPAMNRLASQIQNLSDSALRLRIDIPGLGRAKIAKALADGPKNPDFAKVRDYLQESEGQERASRELYAEHDDREIDHPHLRQIADNLEDDRSSGRTEEENGLIKTFMWGVEDPATGEQVTEKAAVDAMRAGKGRLFQRIRTAYQDALEAVEHDVPFDIPEGGAAADEIQEAKHEFVFVSAAQDPFDGRYGPPPKRLSAEQLEARKAWAARLLTGGTRGTEVPTPAPAAAPEGVEGEAAAEALGPIPGGEGEPVREGQAGPGVGGGRGPGRAPGVRRVQGEPGEAAPEAREAAERTGRTRAGLFQVVNPREAETLKYPAKYELIPHGMVEHLSPDQRLGVAKGIEALDAGSDFLFQDGTGVGKTREILATAYNYAQKGMKVLIVSKSSAIEPSKDAQGKWHASGSYADDAQAMGVPLEFTKERGKALKPGTITLGTYHKLRDYAVDKNTLLVFDEAHQLKNMGDSEVAAEGADQMARAGKRLFATATPGDKAYHLGYLAGIGLFEGKPPEQALKDLGLVAKARRRVSQKLLAQYLKQGLSRPEATEKATEEFQVWKTTSPAKHRKALEALFDRLTERGTVIKREVDLSPVEVQTVVVPLSDEGKAAMKTIEEAKFDRKNALMHMRRQQEPYKLEKVKELVRQELGQGRQVVVFASRVNESEVVERGTFRGEPYARTLMKSEGTLKTLGDWLDQEGVSYAEIHGEAKESSKDAQARFQSGNAKVVIATYEKGGTGINLDDRSGAAPRTMILMTAPFGATDIVQAIGRVHRITTRSPSRIQVLYSDHGVDLWNAAVIGGKLKQHHAQVSGDIAALDLGNTSADEEALSAGSGHYMDVAHLLAGHSPPAIDKPIFSPRHYGKIVRQIRDLGVKYTLKGGDFEIPTHEGFTITGNLQKTPTSTGYAKLRWEHDEEAGDLRLSAAMAPPRANPKSPTLGYTLAELKELSGENVGTVKPIVSQRQYDFLKRRLDQLGATWGVAEMPGAFQVVTKEGQFITGELVPPKREVFGRAPRGEEGAFHWKNLGGEMLTSQEEGKFADVQGAMDRFAQGEQESLDPASEVVGAITGVVGRDTRPGAPIPTYARPDLPWGTPVRLKQGVSFKTGEALPGIAGTSVLATALREGFTKLGRIEWRGQEVRSLADAGALFHTARNPSLEHGAKFFVDKAGKIVATMQMTSDSPNYVHWGPSEAHFREIAGVVDRLRAQGVEVRTIIDLHNHPSGDSTPSKADRRVNESNLRNLGALHGGTIVIDHEKMSILKPNGERLDVVKKAGGFADPDPFLAEGVDAAAFYDPKRPGMVGEPDLRPFAHSLMNQGLWKPGSTDVQVAFVDSQARLRLVTLVPEPMFTNPDVWRRFSTLVGKATGSSAIFGATDGGFTRNPDLAAAATHYLTSGQLQEMIDLQTSIAPSNVMRAAGLNVPSIYRYNDGPQSPVGSTRLEETTRALDRPLSAYPEWEKPDPDWWRDRVKFARARIEERGRGATANMGVDPRAFWDAFVVGVDTIRKGTRKLGEWMSSMSGEIPGFRSWGRRVWDYIAGLKAPVVTERQGAVRPFGEVIAGAEAPLYRGPIRPVPAPTVRDLARATEALLRGQAGEPVDVGAGKPLGVGVPKDLAVNIHQVVDEAGIRENMARIVRAVEKRFDLARRKFTTGDLKQLAFELGYDESDYLRMVRQKGALTAPEIIAGRVLRQHAGVDFANKFSVWNDAMSRAGEVGLAPEMKYRRDLDALDAEREKQASLQKFVSMMYGTAAAGAEAGRALYAHKLLISQLTPDEQFMRKLLRSGRADQQQMAALVEAFQKGDNQAVSRLIRRIYRPGAMKMAIEYFINSLLSAPPTFVANVTGNLIHEAVMRTPERGLAARLEQFGIRQGVERLLTGEAKPTERVVGQAMEALRAQVRHKFGILAALDMARQATTREDLRFLQSVKQEAYVPAIPGTIGKVVRTPGRIMEALDIGAKINAAAAEKSALLFKKAYDDAGRQGIGTPEFKEHLAALHDTMDEWIALETQRREDPKAFQAEHGADGYKFLYQNRDLAEVYKDMEHAANVSTFRDETTRFTGFIKQMRNVYPWLSFIVPFVHTTERILIQGFRRTPLGLAKTLYNIKEGRVSGGEASDRLAQGLLGSAVTGGIYMLAADGLVSGGGPDDPRERENWLKTGKLPYAIKIGKTWVSYARVEPFATIFGFAADLAEAKNAKTAGDAFGKLHYAILNNIANKTYLEGLVSAAEAVGNPDRYMSRYWKRSLGAIVPNLLATAARAIDPTIRETDSFEQVLMARVPILSAELPPRLTGTGEPAVRGETAVSRMVSPVRYSDEAGPEKNLERLFLETGYSPSQPPRKITLPGTQGRQVDLTRQEREIYAAYARRASNFARGLAANKDWSGLDVYGKEELLKRIFRFTHDAAQRDMLASTMNRLKQGQAKVIPR